MVKPDFDLWTGTDPIFRVVNRFCILCLIGSRVGSGNSRVGSGFSFCSPLRHTHVYIIRTITYLDPPHFICKLGVKFKVIGWRDCFGIWLLDKNLILCTRQRMKKPNNIII
ncbi:hypothetical protein Hanom_Chr04g00322661 [Helianthus anomalus]